MLKPTAVTAATHVSKFSALRALSLLAALLGASPPARAWGAEGHETVGTLAAALIKGTPTEAKVAALLDGISLPLATIWADCAKGIDPERAFDYPNKGKYEDCAPLETDARIAEMRDYVQRNSTRCEPGPGDEICHKGFHYTSPAYQRSRYILGFVGTRDADLVAATSAAILKLQGQPVPQKFDFNSKREALLVLAHLIGDLHQPLHVGSIYLDAQGRRVDPDKTGANPAQSTRGGNQLIKAWIKPPSPPVGIAEFAAGFRPPNLHMLWDDVPASLAARHVDAAWLKAARQVPGNPGDVATWPGRFAGGTLEQAGEAFQGLKFSAKTGSTWSVTLPTDYNARMALIKKRQLTLAGARLAQVLKAALE